MVFVLLQTKFDQKCLLYSDVVYEYYNNSAGLHSAVFRVRFGPQSVCEYNLAVSALFSLIYPLVMIGVYIFIYVREKDNKEYVCILYIYIYIYVLCVSERVQLPWYDRRVFIIIGIRRSGLTME